MTNNKNQRISFILPPETTLLEVINEILKKNGLEESSKDYFNKFVKGIESRTIIIRDATISLFQRKASEKTITELLGKHLKISKEKAEKIIQDVSQKLIPFAKIINSENELNNKDQVVKLKEELLKKIKADENNPISVSEEKDTHMHIKKVPITNLEKNAENIEEDIGSQEIEEDIGSQENEIIEEKNKKFGDNKFKEERKGSDTYREPVE